MSNTKDTLTKYIQLHQFSKIKITVPKRLKLNINMYSSCETDIIVENYFCITRFLSIITKNFTDFFFQM